jgi:hypothetical protein
MADMPRIQHRDTPEFVVRAIEGAKPIGSQLAGAAGLLTVLLVAMSAVEAPMPRQDVRIVEVVGKESSPVQEASLLCSIGGKIVSWIAVEAT